MYKNNKIININIRKSIRKLFFQKKEIEFIRKEFNLTIREIYSIIKKNNWIKKRERYWFFLVKKAYRDKISISKISKKCGIKSASVLTRIKIKNKIKTQRFSPPNKRINKDTEIKMISDYEKLMSAQSIAQKYGFKTDKTVLDVLKKYKIKRREPKIITNYNLDYFKKINSYDKAYILGLLFTDGYILKDYKGIGLQLTEKDGYLLKRIALRLGASSSVVHISCHNRRKKAIKENNKNFIKVSDMERLTIHNSIISNDVRKLGVLRNKTHNVRFLYNIPKKYYGSFCRGVWDGDGTVGVAKNKNIWCQVVSASEGFLFDLQNIIPFRTSIYKTNTKLGVLRISGGNKETKGFLKWIYRNKGDMFLERKYAKVQDQIN